MRLRARVARLLANLSFLLLVVPTTLSGVLIVLWAIPRPEVLPDAPYSRVLFDREGRLLGASIAADEQWRFPPGPGEFPKKYVVAVTTFEDERFARHPGIDPIAIARAFASNLAAGRIVSGGSTLTMQLARLARGNRPRTYAQKLAEASLALRLELHYSKKEILRMLASHAPFGGNVVGIEAASWRYFGRRLDDLTWAEAALLAVLPNSPSLIHLSHQREELRAKRDRLLERLHRAGAVDADELRLARLEPLPDEPRPVPQVALHLLGTLAADHPERSRFTTTIDRYLQLRTSELVVQHAERLRSSGARHAAVVVVDVHTGATLAYVGNVPLGGRVEAGDFVDIAQAPRSTGSLLKPILYAAMLDSGELLPRQIVADIPTRIGGYIPENHTHEFTGAIRVDEALARSLNVPAARLLRDYGVSRFYGLLKNMGLSTLTRSAQEYGIPLILGGAEATLWELTGIYASMARTVAVRGSADRSFAMPHLVRPDARHTAEPDGADRGQLGIASPLSPAALYLTLTALNEVERPDELVGWRHFAESEAIAWKTGTSYGLRDAWAIGVTDRHAVGVWVGNASGVGAPGLRGTASAGPLMFQVFELLRGGRGFVGPGGLSMVTVCADSGLLAGPDCRRTGTELVPQGAHDLPVCSYCRTLHLDETGSYQVTSEIYPTARMRHERWFVLPGAMAWYYQQHATGYVPPPPFDPRLAEAGAIPVELEFPLPGARVVIPVEMSGDRGSLVARAHHRDRRARLFWHLDGDFLGATTDGHTMELAPLPGEHRLTVVDEAGHTATVVFEVLDGRS